LTTARWWSKGEIQPEEAYPIDQTEIVESETPTPYE
jgi:hypothetical protein